MNIWTKCLLLFWLAGLSLFDIRYRSVPVWMVSLGGTVVVGAGIYGCIWGKGNPAACLAGMIPGAVLLLLALGTGKAGWVDGIVLMLMGSVLGLWICILAAMFSLVLISVLALVLLGLKRADSRTRIPYIPFLIIGFLLSRIFLQ